ncbi:MAG: hypothetical protein ACRCZF_03720, partial [Gemmataceae bacterium]
MTPNRPGQRERLEALLAERAIDGLPQYELEELRELLPADGSVREEDLELIAAALELGLHAPKPVLLPPELRSKILAAAPAHLPQQTIPATGSIPRHRSQFWSFSGWAVAALVCIATVWWTRTERSLTPIERQSQLLAQAGTATYRNKPGQPAARVVWNADQQDGVLEVRGLPRNDPG